jgi:zinc-ribbon domain
MPHCTRCGSSLPANKQFCSKCGAPVLPVEDPPSPTGSILAPLQSGLQKLGIPVTVQQLVGLIVSIVVGLVLARILPYIYAPTVGYLLDFLQLSVPTRDTLNWFMMTALTFLTSFAVGFILSGRRRTK